MRPCGGFTPSSGSIGMSVLCVAHLRSARGIIELLCTQGRSNPEFITIFGTAARYRRAAVGSSYNDTYQVKSS